MLYDLAHSWLGWPEAKQVFEPEGSGTRVYVDFAQRKIGGALKLAFPHITVNVGVLAENPNSNSTEPPLAVVCEFPQGATNEELNRAHSLAWNFSRTALLITLEPHRLIAWSCYQNPTQKKLKRVCEYASSVSGYFDFGETQNQREVRDLLHWVSLVTSRVQRELPKHFPPAGRADILLLKNLRYVRRRLLGMDLPKEFCHDLLARVIFTQFLFHRKDSDGKCFFSERMMKRLEEDGTLSRYHPDLASILTHKADTYALFRWMDAHFNGDLFPGKGGVGSEDYEGAWRAERKAVSKPHLDLLAQLVRGDLDITGQQLTLWPCYSFDTIPLEFISSIYEEFLTEDEKDADKAYYTPSHLVDYVLDTVLPWNDTNWNIKILDPCCGSGIFLVKAFQRLIYRWRLAHVGQDPLVRDLRPLLANNLVGVDMNKEAVRVACFSLYLAMADAIEPKHYVTRENVNVFPHLRGTRLLPEDFFDEQTPGISTESNAESFDLIIGNPPWGVASIKPVKIKGETDSEYKTRARNNPTKAQLWADAHDWPVANLDIGPAFIGKASELLNQTGSVAMINTASLLYARESTALELRQRLFTSFQFKEVTNLSALRHDLFAKAISPACIFVFGKERPSLEKTLYYFAPKPARLYPSHRSVQASQGFTVEPQDVNTLTHGEAAFDPLVWSVLALGGQRDLRLVRQLTALNTLKKLEDDKKISTRRGVVFGDWKLTDQPHLKGLPLLQEPTFPATTDISLNADTLPKWNEPSISRRDSTKFDAFKLPQVIMKLGFSTELSRFQAVIVRSKDPVWGAICSQSYVSVCDLEPNAPNIRAAWIACNSVLATYFLYNTSSRLGHYRPTTLVEELLSLPIPPASLRLEDISSLKDIDEQCRHLFSLTAADWTLIEDFLSYTLPEISRQSPGPGRARTRKTNSDESSEPYLADYAKIFTRVVKGTFGRDKSVGVTIYTEPSGSKWLPIRMITIHLGAKGEGSVTTVPMEADALLDTLSKFYEGQLKKNVRVDDRRLGFQRIAYFLHPSHQDGVAVMNLTLVKPDERRYWTRSTAMRDADQMASAIFDAAAITKGDAR